jgi:hypothetical protein
MAELTADEACAALGRLGLRLTPAEISVERREHRWLVRLPGERLAWFAAAPEGAIALTRERSVLRLLAERCRFTTPRILAEAADGSCDVRTMVPGAVEPWRVLAAARADTVVARKLGAAMGAILAEQHTRITAEDVAGWLPPRPSWPERAAWIRARLPRVVDDAALVADALAVIEAYEAVSVSAADRALVHGDVGFHNLAIDLASFEVHGIFDYEDPAWADRHHDFRYLVFDVGRMDLLEAARAAYEPVVGVVLSTERVLLYNAACAVTFLAYRAGSGPDERSCGRTLAEDLRWTRSALRAATITGTPR